ncbi:MAG: hypothetical protein ACRDQ7_18280 [Haloechinothrix sp.]
MKKLIDVDDESLEAAKQRLGTTTIKDTVNTALRLAADAGPLPEEVDAALDVLGGIDFQDRAHAWR